MGLIDRLMRSSVDQAVRMQPRRVRRIADETRYATPSERPRVDEFRSAALRLVAARFAVGGLGLIAASRESGGMTVTDDGVDFGDIDARDLLTWLPADAGDPGDSRDALLTLVFASMSANEGIDAVVLAHPPHVLAAAARERLPRDVSGPLGAVAGAIGYGPIVGPGVWVMDGGVMAAGADAVEATARLEAADRIAEIELIARRIEDG